MFCSVVLLRSRLAEEHAHSGLPMIAVVCSSVARVLLALVAASRAMTLRAFFLGGDPHEPGGPRNQRVQDASSGNKG